MTTRALDPRRVVVVGLVLYAAVAALTQPHSGAAAVMVVLPAVLVLVTAGGRRSQPGRTSETDGPVRRTAVAWGLLLALAAAWELAAWLQQPSYDVASYDHPTVSILLDPATDGGPTRFVAWLAWLYVGYRLVRR